VSEFLTLQSPQTALRLWLSQIPALNQSELCPLAQAGGRVLAQDFLADQDLPPFDRSTVDGYAVRARDTHGASDSLPAYLTCVGEIRMGQTADSTLPALQLGECVLIHTGGMLPTGADAVVMVEYTQPVGAEIEVLKAVSTGENTLRRGEELTSGAVALPMGTRLRASEIGGLAALGKATVSVQARPKVAILSSGDEIVPITATPQAGQVRDVNSWALAELVRQAGGEVFSNTLLPDSAEHFLQSAQQALASADVVVFSAGSSVSVRDLTARTIAALGSPGILVHGINIKPGKPTLLAVCADKAVIGLPGNPVSAYIVAQCFLRPLLYHLQHCPLPTLPPRTAQLTHNLAGQAGREDWIPVQLEKTATGWLATPVHGASNLIFTLVRANGVMHIPSAATGLHAGEWVEVYDL
jgi:molybdopterin molybdotransferase